MVEKFQTNSVLGRAYKARLGIEKRIFEVNVIPQILEHIHDSARIIEIGCGQGDKLAVVRSRSMENTEIGGVDSSEIMLDEARRKYPELSDQIRFDDAFNPQTLEGNYDMVLFLKILQYFSKEEIVACLKKYTDHLSPEGVIVILDRFLPNDGIGYYWNKFLIKLYSKVMGFDIGDYGNLRFCELDSAILETGLRIQRRVRIPISGELLIAGR